MFQEKWMDSWRSTAIAELEKKPCTCVSCGECNGTGNVWRNYDSRGCYAGDWHDDLSELEPCDQCHGGIVEVCDRCQEIRDLEEDEP